MSAGMWKLFICELETNFQIEYIFRHRKTLGQQKGHDVRRADPHGTNHGVHARSHVVEELERSGFHGPDSGWRMIFRILLGHYPEVLL